MSLGFLNGDTSLIDDSVVRDFRRSGLSHLLAVSGMHLTVILGAAEFLLERFSVKRGKRMIIASLLALFLLVLSGFSASACRSVLMLLCAYFCYVISSDSDALTSLGISGFIIMLISPRSVGDIGFWLSFLSTFGLVVYLSLLKKKTDKLLKKRDGAVGFAVSVLRVLVFSVLITLCANIFICIVLWLVFGEISVISIVSNLVVSPISSVYLILSLIVFIFGGIPYVSSLLSLVAMWLTSLITRLVSFFSAPDFSVVSLRYPFAGVIIVLGTVSLFFLLIVKLKKKNLLLLPPLVCIVAFCLCLAVFRVFDTDSKGVYVSGGRGEALSFYSRGECVIADVSDGRYNLLYEAYESAHAMSATEVRALVLTNIRERHVASLDSFFRRFMVRSLYIPEPQGEAELLYVSEIAKCAAENEVEIFLYAREEPISFSFGISLLVGEDSRGGVYVASISADASALYVGSAESLGRCSEIGAVASLSDTLIVGGGKGEFTDGRDEFSYPECVVVSDIEMLGSIPIPSRDSRIALYVAVPDGNVRKCNFDFGSTKDKIR